MSSQLINRQQIRMVENTGGTRFLLETVNTHRIRGKGNGKHLDRDLTTDARILCSIDLAHSAGIEKSEDLVLA